MLTDDISDALYVLRSLRAVVRNSFGPCFLSLVDLRWIRKCQLLLRYHTGLEFGALDLVSGHRLRRPPRRMGTG